MFSRRRVQKRPQSRFAQTRPAFDLIYCVLLAVQRHLIYNPPYFANNKKSLPKTKSKFAMADVVSVRAISLALRAHFSHISQERDAAEVSPQIGAGWGLCEPPNRGRLGSL